MSPGRWERAALSAWVLELGYGSLPVATLLTGSFKHQEPGVFAHRTTSRPKTNTVEQSKRGIKIRRRLSLTPANLRITPPS